MAINRSSWSPEERDEFDALLARVISSSTNTTDRLDLMEQLMGDAIQAQRYWASDVDRAARRYGYASEIKKYQDRNRVLVASGTDRVLSLPRIQGTIARNEEGDAYHQRELIELWTWEQILEKRAEAIRARRLHADKVAHYDRLLALRDQCPDSTSPADAARQLGINLDSWLGEAA
jgi:hypothetical protein